jgi:hypothetical protein
VREGDLTIRDLGYFAVDYFNWTDEIWTFDLYSQYQVIAYPSQLGNIHGRNTFLKTLAGKEEK